MTKIKIKLLSKKITYAIFAGVLLLAYYPNIASADPITNRSVTIGSSLASASTTYNFTFTAAQATTIQSVSFAACTTASGACTPAPGFSASSSTLAAATNLGSGGTWTVDTGTAGELRMLNASNTGSPSAGITANFASVTNPSATNSTFFMRIATFSGSDWTGAIDTGVVASSTAGQITVAAAVDETLTFTLASASVNLGTLTKVSTGTGTSSMTVGTNAESGYTVAYSGDTLTSGVHEITAMGAATTSTMNSKQFGINLMANTTPSVGTDVTGTGSGAPETDYDTADTFKFNTSGDVVASAGGSTNDNVFTTSYIANIDSSTAPGAYTTVITYVATANF